MTEEEVGGIGIKGANRHIQELNRHINSILLIQY